MIRQMIQGYISKSVPIMALLSLAYLFLYAYGVIGKPTGAIQQAVDLASNFIWLLFVADLLIRFLGRTSFSSFLKQNWLEILALTLPFIRALRAFRFLLALRLLKSLAKSRREKTIVWTAILFPFIWFVGALAILDAESSSSLATINSIDKALWWALTTMSTVGYGDLFPVTLEGRFVAAALMISGIGLFSVCAGILGSWITEAKPEVNEQ